MPKCFLGIDTSCYTTSVAVVDEKSGLLADERIVLTVAKGARGLRQSEMVFQHTKNLPVLIERLKNIFVSYDVAAVTVTNQPRATEESYMPAFLPGIGLAKALSAVLGVPLYMISHQHNHILAGLWAASERVVRQAVVMHLSGGTTEVVVVDDVFGTQPRVEIIGGTNDISAGQFIDRLGVELGLDFPAGLQLEQLAASGEIIERFPVRLFSNCVSFSGYDTKFAALVKTNIYSKADIAATAQDVIARTLAKLARKVMLDKQINTLLLVGGVASNSYIVDAIYRQIVDIDKKALINTNAKFCPDNAAGAAFYAQIRTLAV
ncbi:MAG: O-sialoglycoprotein endopeptidase [Negativicutes bacterium]|jgi:N6-L-threonylcarbamoyladenine synthase